MKYEINVENAQNERRLFRGYKSLIRGAVKFVLEKEKFDKGAFVDVTFVEKSEIRRLNREFRDKDAETDVLSFPVNDDFSSVGAGDKKNGKIILGDVIICPEYIFHQAKEFGNSFAEETCLMAIHSVLHLIGYDHIKPKDRKIMFPKQEEYFKEYMENTFKEKENG